MKARGLYVIGQTDRILREEELRHVAQVEIVKQLTEVFVSNFGDKIVKEEASQKYPYGRFYLDVNVEPA